MSAAGPKRLSSAQRREQVLKAARTLFANRGYGETTLDAVAEKVGVSRARIIQLFGSKEGIYKAIAATAYHDHPMDRDLMGPMEEQDDLAVFRAFAIHVLHHYANPEEREILKILMYARLREDEFHRVHFEEKDSLMISRLTDYVAGRVRNGVFLDRDPRVAVFAFQAMVTNLAMYKHALGRMDFVTNEDLADSCAEIFIKGLKTEN